MNSFSTSPCAYCDRDESIDALVPIGDLPLCRPCIQALSRDLPPAPKKRRFYKIEEGKEVEGVCGGIADAFEIDRDHCRLAAGALIVLSGIIPGLIVYALLAIALPRKPAEGFA